MGIGWYRYQLTPKDEWKGKRIVLDFQGIMLVGDVYLNGQRIGGTDYGYLGFDIDLSKLLKWGRDKRNRSQGGYAEIQATPAGLRVPVSIVMSISSSPIRTCSSLAIRSLSVLTGNKEVKIKAEIINQQKVAKGQDCCQDAGRCSYSRCRWQGGGWQKNDIHFNAKWRDRRV